MLFNLISDLVGGVRFTVIEEESARPIPPGEQKRKTAEARTVTPAPTLSSHEPSGL